MKTKSIFSILLVTFVVFLFQSFTKELKPKTAYFELTQEELHQKINADMYANFSKAYETLDYDLFASIHSSKMIRVSGSGGNIKRAKAYLEGYKKRWSDPNRKPASIRFRLLERITSDSLVSDRGIYRVAYKNDTGKTQYSYGKFHVLLELEDTKWKILVDYDSDENKTIDSDSYDTAYALEEYKKYWKKGSTH